MTLPHHSIKQFALLLNHWNCNIVIHKVANYGKLNAEKTRQLGYKFEHFQLTSSRIPRKSGI